MLGSYAKKFICVNEPHWHLHNRKRCLNFYKFLQISHIQNPYERMKNGEIILCSKFFTSLQAFHKIDPMSWLFYIFCERLRSADSVATRFKTPDLNLQSKPRLKISHLNSKSLSPIPMRHLDGTDKLLRYD